MTTREIIFMVEEDPEQGYTAKALGFSIFTESNTLSELKEKIKDAIKCHFEQDVLPISPFLITII